MGFELGDDYFDIAIGWLWFVEAPSRKCCPGWLDHVTQLHKLSQLTFSRR